MRGGEIKSLVKRSLIRDDGTRKTQATGYEKKEKKREEDKGKGK